MCVPFIHEEVRGQCVGADAPLPCRNQRAKWGHQGLEASCKQKSHSRHRHCLSWKKNKDVSVKPEVMKAEGSVLLAAAQVCSYTFPASECHNLTTPVNQESCNGNSASRGCLWPEKEEKEPLVSNLSRLAELRKGHLPSWEVTGLLACHQCHLFDQAHPT